MGSISDYDIRVSICKAFAIILMVLAHSTGGTFDHFVNLFHMPLFFFMSGFCFKEKYLVDFCGFIGRKIKGIYLPYIFFGILFVLLHNLLIEINFYNPNCVFGDLHFDYYSKRDIFHNIILTLRMLHEEPLLGGFWFLKSLFWGNLIFYTLIRALKGRAVMTICALFMLSFAFMYYNIIIPYIWLFPTDIFAAFFISMGYIVKKETFFLLCDSVSVCVLCILLLIVGNCFIPYSMSKCIWNYMPFYIIVALAGICILFRLSAIIADSRFQKVINLFKVFGENTISVLTWHFSCFKLFSLFLIGLYSLEFSALAEYPVINDLSRGGWWIMYSLFGLFLPILPKLIIYGNIKK